MTAVGTKGQNSGQQAMAGLTTAAASMGNAANASKAAGKTAKNTTVQTNTVNRQNQAMYQQTLEKLQFERTIQQQAQQTITNLGQNQKPPVAGANSSMASLADGAEFQNTNGGARMSNNNNDANTNRLCMATSQSVINSYKNEMGSYGRVSSQEDDTPPRQPRLGYGNSATSITNNDEEQKRRLNPLQMRK